MDLPWRAVRATATDMARHLRIEYEGALYHVTARGNDRRPIFETDADREHFVELLAEGMERYTVTAYVHLNPVRIKAWRERPLVERFRQVAAYPWSSYGAYTRLRGAPKAPAVSCDCVWGELHARSRKEGRKRYRDYVRGWLRKEAEEAGKPESKRDPEYLSPFRATKYGCVLGGDAFLEFVHDLFDEKRELSQDLVGYRTWRKKMELGDLVTLIAEVRGTDAEVLKERGRGHTERDLAMHLCREVGERELRAIGDAFGVKYAAVSVATKRVKQRMRQDRKFRRQVENARKALIDKLKT